MSDTQLIKGCKKHQPKAQRELYEKYKDVLYILSLKYCKNIEDAQDNLQDAFIEIFKQIKKYKGNGSFEGWMKRITINKAIDKYKASIKINPVTNSKDLPEIVIDEEPLDHLQLNEILLLVQQLPSKYRLVFNLYELDNYSHSEISEMLSISIGTSKSNLHRAKQILKSKIDKLKDRTGKSNENHGN